MAVSEFLVGYGSIRFRIFQVIQHTSECKRFCYQPLSAVKRCFRINQVRISQGPLYMYYATRSSYKPCSKYDGKLLVAIKCYLADNCE